MKLAHILKSIPWVKPSKITWSRCMIVRDQLVQILLLQKRRTWVQYDHERFFSRAVMIVCLWAWLKYSLMEQTHFLHLYLCFVCFACLVQPKDDEEVLTTVFFLILFLQEAVPVNCDMEDWQYLEYVRFQTEVAFLIRPESWRKTGHFETAFRRERVP